MPSGGKADSDGGYYGGVYSPSDSASGDGMTAGAPGYDSSESNPSDEAPGAEDSDVEESAPDEKPAEPSDPDEDTPKDEPDEPEEPETPDLSGLITASEWNDNKNFDYYKTLFMIKDDNGNYGKFAPYLYDSWGFDISGRVSVYVTKGEAPVAGAEIECKNADGAVIFHARTGSDGYAYIFPKSETGSISVKSGEAIGEATFDKDNRDLTVELTGETETKRNKIQIMFVIDITGSMGDEHQYLRDELRSVIKRVKDANEQTEIELALLFYRDNGDREKFAYYDFTDVSTDAGMTTVLDHLSSHYAYGGGDYPEAVDEALDMAVNKNWDADSTTKLIFHLLDAPAHSTDNNKQLYSSAVMTAADKGIKICPILASGADQLCEYIVRQAAVYTGGSFIFITDHSGIGGGHLDPNIPNATVEKLNDLLVRVINGYYTGTFEDPIPWNIKK